MHVYGKGAIGNAWQYNGNIDTCPDWVKRSFMHHIEIDKNGIVRYCTFNESINEGIIVDRGDWFVLLFCNGSVTLFTNDVFKSNFTFSVSASCETGSVFSKKYRSKPAIVDAWQYNGEFRLPGLPYWVFDLILYNRLGYRPGIDPATKKMETLLRFRDEDGIWVQLSVGDWLVYCDTNIHGLVQGIQRIACDDFKELFEEIK